MTQDNKASPAPIEYESILEREVPKGREGKHKRVIVQLLGEIDRLEPHTALKISLAALPDSKANIRAALNRATRQRGMRVATSSDSHYLYLWKVNHNA